MSSKIANKDLVDSYPGEFTRLNEVQSTLKRKCNHCQDYLDDNGITRCWVCDADLRTDKGDI